MGGQAAKAKSNTFSYDAVFGCDSSQEEVFAEVQPVVTSVMDGYNVCIFAYGQTGPCHMSTEVAGCCISLLTVMDQFSQSLNVSQAARFLAVSTSSIGNIDAYVCCQTVLLQIDIIYVLLVLPPPQNLTLACLHHHKNLAAYAGVKVEFAVRASLHSCVTNPGTCSTYLTGCSVAAYLTYQLQMAHCVSWSRESTPHECAHVGCRVRQDTHHGGTLTRSGC